MKYCFIDTDVLCFSCLKEKAEYEQANRTLEDLDERGGGLVISEDVLTEFIRTVLRGKDSKPIKREDVDHVLKQVAIFRQTYRVLINSTSVLDKLIDIYSKKEISGNIVYDAKHVACMLCYGITHILTNNVKHLKKFEPEITVIPLSSSKNPNN